MCGLKTNESAQSWRLQRLRRCDPSAKSPHGLPGNAVKKHTIKPYLVGGRWRIIIPKDLSKSPKRRVKWFAEKSKAERFANQLEAQRTEFGAGFHSLSNIDQALVLRSIQEAGDAPSLYDAVRFWKSQKPERTITMAELVTQCVRTKERSGKSDHYCSCLRNSLNSFALDKKEMLAHLIQPHHVESFIHKEASWSAYTRKTYLRDLVTLFSWGQKNGHLVTNPAAKVERIVMPDTAPPILTVEQCEQLMRTAERSDRGLIPFLALCLFGGLRPSEALRIQPENIKENHVEVYGKKVRARNRRLVAINATLRAWLALGGEMAPENLAKRMRAVRGNIPWAQDCLRHSFVSYHVAIHSAAETSREAGHSEAVLFKHYRELVPRSEAERFWKILPIG